MFESCKWIAINIDGPCIVDAFSPVLRLFVEKNGGIYDAEVERNVFSQKRSIATEYLNSLLNLKLSENEFVENFFALKRTYEEKHPTRHVPKLKETLNRFKRQGFRLLCYGGLDEKYFQSILGPDLTVLFEGYFCVNDSRPGIKEILKHYKIAPREIIFIDDIASVGIECLNLGCNFIGIPSTPFQDQFMRSAGITHIYSNLAEVPFNVS